MSAPKSPHGIKVSVVGPSGAGKSTVANYLASENEDPAFKLGSNYVPTVGVRILEVERSINGPVTPIEIWDTSGAPDYESCWPAVMRDTAGVILVYNPENEGHVSESGAWYDFFVKKNNLSDDQCIVLALSHNQSVRQRTSPKLKHLNVLTVSLQDGQMLMQHFDQFLRVIKQKIEAKVGEEK